MAWWRNYAVPAIAEWFILLRALVDTVSYDDFRRAKGVEISDCDYTITATPRFLIIITLLLLLSRESKMDANIFNVFTTQFSMGRDTGYWCFVAG